MRKTAPNLIHDAVVIVPTRKEEKKLYEFLEVYSNVIWANGSPVTQHSYYGGTQAYHIENNRFMTHGSIRYFEGAKDGFEKELANQAFLISVDEYIARSLGACIEETDISSVTDLI